jgi:competence protein ComEC
MELNSPDASLELNRAPFIRLLFALIAGILSSRIVLFSNIVLSCLPLLLLTGSLAAFVFRKLFLTIRGHYLFGVYILILLFITGDALSLLQDEKSQSIELYHSLGNRNVFYSLHLISSCVEKEKTCKAIAELDFCGQPGNWHRIRGKVLMHLRKSKAALSLKYGDRLLLEGRIQELNAPPNPGMFDYRHYLADRNIFLQVWCDSSSWKQEPGNGVAWLLHICSAGRDQMLALLRKHHIDGDELGVGAALLLGYEDKLSPDILQAYSSSGVMHVLSVSGLHVAILFAVLNACLGFTRRVSYGPFLKALILLLFLCLYATLTGLSPAVLRSSGMFCFVILGEASRRTSSIFNTLSASAFLLLLINPMLLYDAGFQLSYLAVLGIVVLQPSLQKIWEAPFWLARQIYTMICVSVAAQLFTLPLSLYYFHQFPNYFLITNLVVIPLSTFVIYAGIGFFFFASPACYRAFFGEGICVSAESIECKRPVFRGAAGRCVKGCLAEHDRNTFVMSRYFPGCTLLHRTETPMAFPVFVYRCSVYVAGMSECLEARASKYHAGI